MTMFLALEVEVWEVSLLGARCASLKERVWKGLGKNTLVGVVWRSGWYQCSQNEISHEMLFSESPYRPCGVISRRH